MPVFAPEINTTIISQVFKKQQQNLQVLRNEPINRRKDRLKRLRQWIHTNRPRIHTAIYSDFRKPSVEVDGTEIFHVLSEIRLAVRQLDHWARPTKVDAPWTMLGTRSLIQYEPRGACLIIAPWNYPFSLAVGPLVSALAAGNSIIIKPSELTPNVSALLKQMVTEIFDEDVVAVVEGDAAISQALLSLPFNHIFFTGSPAVGKSVMKAAAEHLTSVTLELGGKSPTIVTANANLADAARRIAVSKFINNGQTCVAPDYILVDERIQRKFTEALITQIKQLFTSESETFETSTSYSRIVNHRHFTRLTAILQNARDLGAKLEFGGDVHEQTRFIHPVILSDVALQADIMHEEIFGPILPIVSYNTLEVAIDIINAKPKPLALYLFSQSGEEQRMFATKTSSGAMCINDCAIHFLNHNLPFGGINNSGIGRSHGHFGFLSFSHEKAVLKQKNGFTSIQPFYPPYTLRSRKLMDWFFKLF